MEEKVFGIRLDCRGFSPNSVRLRDLYDFLHAFESAIAYTAEQKGGPSTETDLHLINVAPGSAIYEVAVSTTAYSSAIRCAEAIASRDLSALPEKARDSLLTIQAKARAKDWVFSTFGTNGMPEASISPETEFITDSIISGTTSISGKLVRVGGTPHPTAQLLLPDNRRLTAKIATEALAIRLGAVLYQFIVVEGDARWTTADWWLIDFKITSLGEYDDKASLTTTLNELTSIANGFWDDIDPECYIAGLRSEVD